MLKRIAKFFENRRELKEQREFSRGYQAALQRLEKEAVNSLLNEAAMCCSHPPDEYDKGFITALHDVKNKWPDYEYYH